MVAAKRANGAVCIGREAIPVGVFSIKNCTGTVPHNITLFVGFAVAIVPESIRGLLIDQRSSSCNTLCLFWHSPVCVICTLLFLAWPLNQRVHEA
jgi:Ca2+/Na+ antiporter